MTEITKDFLHHRVVEWWQCEFRHPIPETATAGHKAAELIVVVRHQDFQLTLSCLKQDVRCGDRIDNRRGCLFQYQIIKRNAPPCDHLLLRRMKEQFIADTNQ